MVSRANPTSMDPLGSPVSLAQLLDTRGVEDILGSFYAVFRLPVRIIDEEGASVARSRKPSPLNEYLGQLPGARKRLGDEHQYLRSHDPDDSGEFTHDAFSGATYHVAMIGHDGRRVGRFILGPFITPHVRDAPASLFESDKAIDPARARDLLLSLPRVRQDTVKAIARHLSVMLDVLIFAGHRALLSEFMHLSTVQENQRQLSVRDEGLLAAEQRLVQSSRLQAAFLATALGELRAPLESIMGQSDALSSGIEASGQRDVVLAIRQRAAELVGLSNRLVDFSRADTNSLTLRRDPIDVRALVQRAAERLLAMAPERVRGVRAECDPDLPRLLGDAGCLEQVLMLLGENALRFGAEGEVVLSARRQSGGAEDGDGMILFGGPPEVLELRVTDFGCGIPDAEKERVFEPFYRSPRGVEPSARSAGSGLGLAIARRLITAHGGSIRIEDNLPRGTSLVVVVPASGPPGSS